MSAEWTFQLRDKEVLIDAQKQSVKGLTNLAEEMVSLAKTEHSYQNRTGTNESSITWDEKDGDVKVYTQSGYGGFLELKLPYLYPALEKARNNLKKHVEGN